jgi:hypothetical protein
MLSFSGYYFQKCIETSIAFFQSSRDGFQTPTKAEAALRTAPLVSNLS